MGTYKSLVKKISIPVEKKIKQKDYLIKGTLAVIDQGKNLIGGYTDDLSKIVQCELPVIVFGDHTKSVKYVDFPFAAGADGIKVLQPIEGILPRYLYYVTQYLTYKIIDKGYARHYQHIEKREVEIPSVLEQERIVVRIEKLFSELDKAVETLETTKQQLAVYRQAVLQEVFRNDKTTQMIEMDSLVNDIRIGPFGTMLHKSDYISGGIPVINPQHIKNNEIIPKDNISISSEKSLELSSYKLQTNDIVMGRRGEMGRAAAITEKENGWLCGTGSILFRLKLEFDATFYARILSSPDVVKYLEEHATGTTMKNLNEEIVKHIPVPYITKEMQQQISTEMDMKMSVCNNIEQTIDFALLQADAMRQSILKRTFEGRLK